MNAVVNVIIVMKFKSFINDNNWSFIVLNRFMFSTYSLSSRQFYFTYEF